MFNTEFKWMSTLQIKTWKECHFMGRKKYKSGCCGYLQQAAGRPRWVWGSCHAGLPSPCATHYHWGLTQQRWSLGLYLHIAQSTINILHRDEERDRKRNRYRERTRRRRRREPGSLSKKLRTETEKMEANSSRGRTHSYPGETNTSVLTHSFQTNRHIDRQASLQIYKRDRWRDTDRQKD